MSVKKVRDIQSGDVHVDGTFISSARPVHPNTVALMQARTPLAKRATGDDWWQARIRLNDGCIRMKVWFHGGDALVDLSAPSSVGHTHNPDSKYLFKASTPWGDIHPTEYQADDRVYYPDGTLRPLQVTPHTHEVNWKPFCGQVSNALEEQKLRDREAAALKRMSQIPVGDPYMSMEMARATQQRLDDNEAARWRMKQSFPELMNPARIRGRQIFEEAVYLVEALESAQRTIHSAVCRGRNGDKHHTECTQATAQIQHARDMGIK